MTRSIKTCPDCEKPVEADAKACTHCGTALAAAMGASNAWWLKLQEDLERATEGEYEVERLIGFGGMAGVYLARDLKLGRQVALKLISPAVVTDPTMVQRFHREARTMAGLSHRHIVPIHGIHERGHLVFIDMKHVPGRTLAEVVTDAGEPLPWNVVATWLAQISRALAHAHSQRTAVIHRDIKPSNILLDEYGDAQLTDFGIAKIQGDSKLTRTHAVIGTPSYMSPEQIGGKPLTPASDQYSLGTVAYELLAGVPPFQGPTLMVLQAHTNEAAPQLRERRDDCPGQLADVVSRMLAKDPADRWQGMAKVAEEFTRALESPVPPATLISWSKRVYELAMPTGPGRLSVGTSERIYAKLLDGQGVEIPGRPVNWASTDERIAFVSPDGVVAGLGVGSALIVAKSGGAMNTLEVEVLPPQIDHLVVSPPRLTVSVGDIQAITVMCYSDAGVVVEASHTLKISDPRVASIDGEGRVVALAPGQATLTVEAGPLRESVRIQVTAASAAEQPFGSATGIIPRSQPDQPGHPAPGGVDSFDWGTPPPSAGVDKTVVFEGSVNDPSDGGPVGSTRPLPPKPHPPQDPKPRPSVRKRSVRERPKEQQVVAQPAEGAARWRRRNRVAPLLPRNVQWVGGGIAALVAIIFLILAGRPDNPGIAGEIPPPLVLASLLPGDTTITSGDQVQFSHGLDDGQRATVAPQWTSSDPSVVTIDGSGLAIGRAAGTALISLVGTGLAQVDPLVLNVVSSEPPGQLAILGPAQIDVSSGPLTYRLQDADGTVLADPSIQWSVDPPGFATITTSGRLVGTRAGSVSLVASLGGRTVAYDVRIIDGTPARPTPAPTPVFRDLQIGSIPPQIRVGASIQLSAWLRDQDFQRHDPGDLVWSSADEAVLRSAGGSVFRAIAPGQVTVQATSPSVRMSHTASITVLPAVAEPPPSSGDDMPVPSVIRIAPGPAELDPGQTERLTATVLDEDGGTLERPTTWTSSDPGVATVDEQGTVTAVTAGTAWIVASHQGVRDSVTATVVSTTASREDFVRLINGYLASLRQRDGGRLRSLVPAEAMSEMHEDLIDEVSDGRMEPLGEVANLEFEGSTATFSVVLRRRTRFGNNNEREVAFVAGVAPTDGGWSLVTCVIAPGSTLP